MKNSNKPYTIGVMAKRYNINMIDSLPLFPGLKIGSILKKPDLGKLRLLPNAHDWVPTYSGTTALSLAAKSLKKLDRTHILVPSFNCGHEIEPFLRENFKIDMYRVNRYGIIDLEHLDSQLTGNRQVVLVTHFFGFPQPVEEISALCKTRNIFMLEDCAHSFQSHIDGTPLGSWGDLSIYSYRKTLPSPDGGALIINNPAIELSRPASLPNTMSVLKKTAELVMNQLMASASISSPIGFKLLSGIKRILLMVQSAIKMGARHDSLLLYSPDDESYEYSSEILNWQISKLSTSVIGNCDHQEARVSRIRNYQYVAKALDKLKKLRPLFPALPDGTCPLGFPFVGPDDRNQIDDIMRNYPYLLSWWPQFHPGMEWHDFAESAWLKRNCYVMSIHQDLKKSHLDFLIDCALAGDQDLQRKSV